jgi:hypothetical protein
MSDAKVTCLWYAELYNVTASAGLRACFMLDKLDMQHPGKVDDFEGWVR